MLFHIFISCSFSPVELVMLFPPNDGLPLEHNEKTDQSVSLRNVLPAEPKADVPSVGQQGTRNSQKQASENEY